MFSKALSISQWAISAISRKEHSKSLSWESMLRPFSAMYTSSILYCPSWRCSTGRHHSTERKKKHCSSVATACSLHHFELDSWDWTHAHPAACGLTELHDPSQSDFPICSRIDRIHSSACSKVGGGLECHKKERSTSFVLQYSGYLIKCVEVDNDGGDDYDNLRQQRRRRWG